MLRCATVCCFLLAMLSCEENLKESNKETKSKIDKGISLATREIKLCDSLDIDTSIVKELREYTPNPIEAFHYSLGKTYKNGKWIEADPMHLQGFVFDDSARRAYEIVFALKDKFRAKGYTIFLLENHFGIDGQPDVLGVLKTGDEYTVLKQIGTDGINYNISNDSLIQIIEAFDEKYSLELIGASGDWCEFIINEPPKDWEQMAKDVYNICPDVVDQGTGSIRELGNEMRKTKRLYLWWD